MMLSRLQKFAAFFSILAICVSSSIAWGQGETEKKPSDVRDKKFEAIQKELETKSDKEKSKEAKEILDNLSKKVNKKDLNRLKSQIHTSGYFTMVKSFIPIIQAYRPLIDCEQVFQDMKNNRLVKLGNSTTKPLEIEIQQKIIEKGYITERQFCRTTKEKYLKDISYYVKRASQSKSRVENEYKKPLWKKLRKFQKSAMFLDNFGKNFEKFNFLPAQLQSDIKKVFYTPPEKISGEGGSAVFDEKIFKKN